MELRDIEIFLTLAEELHFGRTAERLRLTPARVSQSVKAQERRIGGPLFVRTTRTVRLTTLGKQLQKELGVAHRQITAAVQNATIAAGGGIAGTLILGSMGAQPFTITPVLDLFRERHPDVELVIREIHPTAPLNELRTCEVDVAHLWLPVGEPDIAEGPVVHVCDAVLMVNEAHPLAGRTSVTWEDLGDCVVLRGVDVPRAMEEVFHPHVTPSGRPIPRGPVATSWHEEMTLVAANKAVAVVASDAILFYKWPNIVYIPITDAAPVRWAFAWRASSETPLIRALAEAARDASSRPESINPQ
ncbi:LysR family transcriptional regulator [Hamadaea tsunoensis]|uniref:LysR family transcriptional regulator n=1 Tax=Hamadaea tsunoensis TaxID=53368 RepID=UPI000402B9C2|nr:LysR family transcriptional regulator [Hamadaea tsunoensis]